MGLLHRASEPEGAGLEHIQGTADLHIRAMQGRSELLLVLAAWPAAAAQAALRLLQSDSLLESSISARVMGQRDDVCLLADGWGQGTLAKHLSAA